MVDDGRDEPERPLGRLRVTQEAYDSLVDWAGANLQWGLTLSDAILILTGKKDPVRATRRIKSGSIPPDKKARARELLLQNMTLAEVQDKLGLHLNAVKGVWSALKAERRVPANAIAGRLIATPLTPTLPGSSPHPPSG